MRCGDRFRALPWGRNDRAPGWVPGAAGAGPRGADARLIVAGIGGQNRRQRLMSTTAKGGAMEFLSDYWLVFLGLGEFVAGRLWGSGSSRDSGEVGGAGLGDWLSGDGDGDGGGD